MPSSRLVSVVPVLALASCALAGCAVDAQPTDSIAHASEALTPVTLRYPDPVTSPDGLVTVSNLVVARAADGALSVSWHWARGTRQIDAKVAIAADGTTTADGGANLVHTLATSGRTTTSTNAVSTLQTESFEACGKALDALHAAVKTGTVHDILVAARGVVAQCAP
jgi:hypothetical protein